MKLFAGGKGYSTKGFVLQQAHVKRIEEIEERIPEYGPQNKVQESCSLMEEKIVLQKEFVRSCLLLINE